MTTRVGDMHCRARQEANDTSVLIIRALTLDQVKPERVRDVIVTERRSRASGHFMFDDRTMMPFFFLVVCKLNPKKYKRLKKVFGKSPKKRGSKAVAFGPPHVGPNQRAQPPETRA